MANRNRSPSKADKGLKYFFFFPALELICLWKDTLLYSLGTRHLKKRWQYLSSNSLISYPTRRNWISEIFLWKWRKFRTFLGCYATKDVARIRENAGQNVLKCTDSTKINRTYVQNEFLTADCSCRTKYFSKNSYWRLYSTSLRFLWHLLLPNWSVIRGNVSL